MKKILFSVLAVALLWSCGKDDGPDTPPASTKPTITDFTPKTGPEGTEVTITGTNFSTTKTENTVKFGDITAMVDNATATQLMTKVPTGATTGKITVTVDGQTATSTGTFTVGEVEPDNQAPEMEDQELTVAEDIADTDEIDQVMATDADGDDLTFAMVTNDNDLFMLSESGILTLAEGKTLDYETATSHSITVSVTDGEETVEATVTITVENVMDTTAEDPTSFVTKWETTTPEETIYIGANADYAYDFTVDWGDGTVETINELPENHMFEHTYAEPGIHTVAIQGTFPAIRSFTVYEQFDNDDEQLLKLVGLEEWGTIVWQNFSSAFYKCGNMVYNATDAPDLSNVKILASMFNGASLFNGNLNDWNTETITNMSFMFAGATSFNGDISGWNTSKVINMEWIFSEATSFNGDISEWDTSNVVNMISMFYGATSFDQNLGGWDIGSVDIDLGGMASMLDNSGMSKENFNATLIGWHGYVSENNAPLDINLGAAGLTLCGLAPFEAADDLETSYGWDIQGIANFELECN
ncbi:BspA family leucine-rich repeat surface protein [Flagellimonas oceani]|uniref:BspA family leucine-rich repeat surface protein n=1 Tax=Flagellimonas oceani TaxID=2698672 RepID=A0A6G7J4S5_9FLAO|nr:BspA family leucine-rich repeat surface protein [Allomuricauda oceani]QII45609.1 BspA family leucine-rich repeat surface protein [Allomuricauda oceani]